MRPTLNEYFMNIADVIATRSTCLRRQVGAVIVREKQILSTGYNGAPAGISHCKTCLREDLKVPSGERQEICYATHAEGNAIAQAAKHGISINNSTLYCTTYPCSMCAKLIVNAGIKKVFFHEGYPDNLSSEILQNVEVTQL